MQEHEDLKWLVHPYCKIMFHFVMRSFFSVYILCLFLSFHDVIKSLSSWSFECKHCEVSDYL